jgi:hypothetical protein
LITILTPPRPNRNLNGKVVSQIIGAGGNEPIPPRHGAPLRLVVPFRYGNRSVKAITEIIFSTPGLPALPLPA